MISNEHAALMLLGVFALVLLTVPALADPIEPGAIRVIDGDTVKVSTVTYRLVGFDAPETGYRARCESERSKGAEAARRLRQLVAGGGLDLSRVPCACPQGTELTARCNYGRACGVLTARGKDVGEILIEERLARKYVCTGTHCPKREGWCE
jgi:endonuclease YncB( thermonuclease family)